MRAPFLFTATLIVAAGFAAGAGAQNVTVVNYVCNIEGVPAQLTAQVQAVSPAGVFMGQGGGFGGAIGTGEVNYYYQGQLISQTGGRYSFTGENAFADFVDLNTNDRFRVQLTVQGPILVLLINPQGPGPVQYMCQQAGAGQGGGYGGYGGGY
jgi:hypothetical protein